PRRRERGPKGRWPNGRSSSQRALPSWNPSSWLFGSETLQARFGFGEKGLGLSEADQLRHLGRIAARLGEHVQFDASHRSPGKPSQLLRIPRLEDQALWLKPG